MLTIAEGIRIIPKKQAKDTERLLLTRKLCQPLNLDILQSNSINTGTKDTSLALNLKTYRTIIFIEMSAVAFSVYSSRVIYSL